MAKLYSRSFNGGIISPEMFGRLDDIKYNTGLRQCMNFIVLPQGPIEARPGFRFVREVKDSSKATRLLPFRFSTTQTAALEFGEAYIRFHSFGGTVLTPTSGISAWDSGTAYVPGDIVTAGGETWYCVAANTNETPTDPDNQHGAAPAVSSVWQLTAPNRSSPPPGYTNVGSSLPLVVTVGQQVYIRSITTSVRLVFNPAISEFEPVLTTTTVYDGYTGVSTTAPGGFWYLLGEAYEIPSPYAENDLASLTYVQSADVMTICHPRYPPHELRRYGDTRWVMAPVQFGSRLSAPAISGVTATTAASPSDLQSYSYVATNVSADQTEESVASAEVLASNQLFDTGAFNTINFASAGRRNVYKLSGGQYGFIGQTTTTSLVDDNIAADTSRTPPLNQNPFNGEENYPGAVGYFEQRRTFGGTINAPQTFWTTRTGLESNLDYSIPVRADDAIEVRMAARESSIIRHIVPVGDLLLLTDSGEWLVSASDGGALTPFNVSMRPQSYIGANLVQPAVVGNSAVYAAARGGHLRAAGYNYEVNSYVSIDMSIRAAHLFDFRSIVDLAYSKGPTPIVWAVSSSGSLLGMTYVPEESVAGWHEHTTEGNFESICVIGEGNDDVPYVIVRRSVWANMSLGNLTSVGTTAFVTTTAPHLLETGSTVHIRDAVEPVYNGMFTITVTSPTEFTYTLPDPYTGHATGDYKIRGQINRRYVECMASRLFLSAGDYFGVDSGLTYSGPPATTISGLDHLEGLTVAINANGAVLTDKLVTNGQITLEEPVTYAHIGLPVEALAETLPVAAEIEAYAQSTIKNVSKVTLRLERSGAFFTGPDLQYMKESKIRTTEPYGSPPSLKSGEVDVSVSGSWQQDGKIFIRRVTPTPLTVKSMTLELVFGG